MADTKFTPGPWRIDGLHQLDGWGAREGEDRCELASIPHPTFDALEIYAKRARDDFAEHEANAHLIAAAPELYEALNAVYASNSLVDNPDWWGKVFAALAKARGEQ